MLRGERVLLRPMRGKDVPRLHEFNQDVELALLDSHYPEVASVERTREFYEAWTKTDEDRARFAIEADSKFLGYCQLVTLQRRHGIFELGILIGDRDYWGRGYGREVVRLLLDYGFRYLGGRRIALTTHAKNERAIRCYLACGFVEEGRPRQVFWHEGEYIDLVEMSILRDEWEAKG